MKTQLQIQKICKIGNYTYSCAVFESGINYLAHETKNNDRDVSELSQTSMFWNWWQQIVSNRNKQFIQQFQGSTLSSMELIDIWESMLSVRSLMKIPAVEIWEDGYENLIQQLCKQ
jgi:hypothetical protein